MTSPTQPEPDSVEGTQPQPDPSNTSIDQLVVPLDADDDVVDLLSKISD